MAGILSTTAEIKQRVMVDHDLTLSLVEPKLRTAEQMYLLPVLGAEFFAALENHYTSSGSGEDSSVLDEVLSRAQDVVAIMAMKLALPELQVQIGDGGLHVTWGEVHKTPFQWQVGDLANSLHQQGLFATELLYEYLESNIDALDTWAASSACSYWYATLLHNAKGFQDLGAFNIQYNRATFVDLRPAMVRVQDLLIASRIGDAFLQECLIFARAEGSGSGSGSGSGYDDAMATGVEYLQKALASLSVCQAKEVRFMYLNGGLISTRMEANQATKEVNEGEIVIDMRSQACATGMAYLAKALAWFNDNAEELPTFQDGPGYIDDGGNFLDVDEVLHNSDNMIWV